ncbi:MAG TPA: hypothetical protein VKF62_00415 [Planctomycetota bacterium]|nr:hypothetical protein [Planctomycetota bacterium]
MSPAGLFLVLFPPHPTLPPVQNGEPAEAKPAAYSIRRTEAAWRMRVSTTAPRPVSLVGTDGRSRAFWWSEVRVTNNTGEARPLSISARLLLDRGAERPALYRPDVDKAIQETAGRGVENILAWTGEIAPGESKRGVAVFSDVDPVADRLDVRVGGAACAWRRAGAAWYVETVEHATVFARPGDEMRAWSRPIRKVSEDWVVVTSKKVRG